MVASLAAILIIGYAFFSLCYVRSAVGKVDLDVLIEYSKDFMDEVGEIAPDEEIGDLLKR